MTFKKKISTIMFAMTLFALPLLSSISTSTSQGFGLYAIWGADEGVESNMATSFGLVIEGFAGSALALGAICPPQFVAATVLAA